MTICTSATAATVAVATDATSVGIRAVDLERKYLRMHYDLPGIEDVWGLGETEAEAFEDLCCKIGRIRQSLERVW